jgi:hypothetical protein
MPHFEAIIATQNHPRFEQGLGSMRDQFEKEIGRYFGLQ